MGNDTTSEKESRASDSQGDLPQWFREGCHLGNMGEDPVALARLLNGSRQDVFSALSLYQVPVKYVTTLVLSLITVVGVVFSFVKSTQFASPEIVKLVESSGAGLLVIASITGGLSAFVITRYYNVYVSALLFAAQLHCGAGIRSFHWLERLIHLLEDQANKISRQQFISQRTWSRDDSHFWYVVFIVALSVLSMGAAVVIWVVNPISG